jgi:hypothetical protein
MHRAKMLGMVAVAALAITTMIGVGSASAAKFHVGTAGVSLFGEQTSSHVFAAGGNAASCTTAQFSGTAEGTENGNKTGTTQKMHPVYNGCTAFGFVGATVDTTGCTYTFNSNNEQVTLAGCTNGGITIHVSAFFDTTTCHVFIKNQGGINNNKIPAGISTDTDMTVETSSNNIHYEVLTDKGACPYEKAGQTGTNASYTGTTKVKANAGATTIWKE